MLSLQDRAASKSPESQTPQIGHFNCQINFNTVLHERCPWTRTRHSSATASHQQLSGNQMTAPFPRFIQVCGTMSGDQWLLRSGGHKFNNIPPTKPLGSHSNIPAGKMTRTVQAMHPDAALKPHPTTALKLHSVTALESRCSSSQMAKNRDILDRKAKFWQTAMALCTPNSRNQDHLHCAALQEWASLHAWSSKFDETSIVEVSTMVDLLLFCHPPEVTCALMTFQS